MSHIQPIQTNSNRSCSDMISYVKNMQGKYTGTISVISDIGGELPIKEQIIKINFNNSIINLEIKSPRIFHLIKENNTTFLIENLQLRKSFLLRFIVKYNIFYKYSPNVTSIYLNDELICTTKNATLTKKIVKPTTVKPTTIFDKIPTQSHRFTPFSPSQFYKWFNLNEKSDTKKINSIKTNFTKVLNNHRHQRLLFDDCGISPSVEFGTETTRRKTEIGEFPWHAAIFYKKSSGYFFECGGTLISRKAIITAGHCVTYTGTKEILVKENFLVYLGLYNLRRELGGEQVKIIYEIIVHPEYEKKEYYSDLAIMKFYRPIEPTINVRPVCLWSTNTTIESLENQMGIVPGWGLNGYGQISANLTSIKMPVIPRETCLKVKPDIYSKMLLGKSYCAGKTNGGSSVCNGDSGGGMIFKTNGTWSLRGIVSVSIRRNDSTTCDLNFYPVFTDAAKFVNWIKENSV